MKHLLFPTDFSATSFNAFSFALEYADKLGLDIIVYHAYDQDDAINTGEEYDQVDIDKLREHGGFFRPFEDAVKAKESAVSLKYSIEQGAFLESFKAYVESIEEDVDCIVMGTENNGLRLLEFFFNSNTIKLMTSIGKPVVAVPEGTRFDGALDNVLFLVDYKDDELESLQNILKSTKEFDAKLHVVHFDVAHSDALADKMDALRAKLADQDLSGVSFESIDTIDIKKSLMAYCDQHNIDLVYLVNRERNFYQRLFSYSLTEDLVKEMQLPVMSLYVS